MRQRSRRVFDCPGASTPYTRTGTRSDTDPLATHTQACTHARTHAHLGLHCSGPRRPPRRSIASAAAMRCVCDGAVSLCNRQQAACDIQHARRDKRQQATRRGRYATRDRRLATHTMQPMRCDVGPGDRQRTPCDMGHWDGQQATDHMQRRTCDMQRRTCSRHDPTDSVPPMTTGKRAADN